jgi:hypothetical protein
MRLDSFPDSLYLIGALGGHSVNFTPNQKQIIFLQQDCTRLARSREPIVLLDDSVNRPNFGAQSIFKTTCT